MATSSAPSTPPAAKTSQPATVTPSPGTWRHPQFNDIVRRQKATTFDETNIKKIIWNGGALVVHYMLGPLMYDWTVSPICSSCGGYSFYVTSLIRFILLYNVLIASLPLFRQTDNLVDIPLNSTQRSLLGLDPNATPPITPGIQYVTPPRYALSATPRTSTPGSRGSSAPDSPLSRKGSPSVGRPTSDLPGSPVASSLWQKSMGTSKDTRRNSFGYASPVGGGSNGKDMSVYVPPSTPSPSGRGAGVSLNNRWLYERGRSSSGSRSVYG